MIIRAVKLDSEIYYIEEVTDKMYNSFIVMLEDAPDGIPCACDKCFVEEIFKMTGHRPLYSCDTLQGYLICTVLGGPNAMIGYVTMTNYLGRNLSLIMASHVRSHGVK